jgi:hypothetical protein
MLRRTLFVGLISGVALVLSAAAAIAAPTVPNGTTSTFLDAPAGEVCPFHVVVTITANSTIRAIRPNGVQVIAGPGVATATNEDTGRSATYNVSGPGTFDPATNRLTLFGQGLIDQPSSVGSPFLITTSGKVSFIVEQPIDQALRGHISHDICAELA